MISHLKHLGQENLAHHLENLPPGDREILAKHLAQVDFPLLHELFREFRHPSGEKFPGGILPLQERDYFPVREPGGVSRDILTLGENYLSAGRLAVVLLAGGVGSRLAFSGPKGEFPITPVTGKSLFEVHFEKIRRLQQKYAVALRVYLMTSAATDAATREYLAEHDYFGIPRERISVFRQGEMPAFSAETGEVYLKNPREICHGPDGHGGMLAALQHSGAYTDMESHGVESVFTFHVDNPLVPIADPGILGCHLEAESEMSLLAVHKSHGMERVGNVVRRGGSQPGLSIVEYFDFPEMIAEQRGEDDSLKYWAGSIGIHVLDVSFMRRMTERIARAPMSVPWHFPLKKIRAATAGGEEEDVMAIKPERFIFDILPFARFPLVLAVDREETFATLKDDPEPVMEHLSRLYKKWLRGAGAIFSEDAAAEIAPAFAMNAHELRMRMAPGTVFGGKEIFLR